MVESMERVHALSVTPISIQNICYEQVTVIEIYKSSILLIFNELTKNAL
jgi:hypothetical protein